MPYSVYQVWQAGYVRTGAGYREAEETQGRDSR
jgi:hypothetical protein